MTHTVTECPGSDTPKKRRHHFLREHGKVLKLEVGKFDVAGVRQCSCVFTLNGSRAHNFRNTTCFTPVVTDMFSVPRKQAI